MIFGVFLTVSKMSLRETKALACSPQPNWVFNSSLVLPLKEFEDCAISKPLLVARSNVLENILDSVFKCVSPMKVTALEFLLDGNFVMQYPISQDLLYLLAW